MAHCSQNTYEFIKSIFGPKVAVTSSKEAEDICLHHGLSIVELLKPFSLLNSEFQIRDPTNAPHIIKGLNLSFNYPIHSRESVQIFRKVLSDEISSNFTPGNVGVKVKGHYVKQSCPWYEAFRDLYFQHFKVKDHDSIMHFMACIVLVSANEDNPVEQVKKLREEITSISRWVEPEYMTYNVIIHDASKPTKTPVQETLQALSTLYGPAMCNVMKLNSGEYDTESNPGPNPWRQFAKGRNYSDNEVDKTAQTLLQMAMDDDSDSVTDPLGATETDDSPVHSFNNNQDNKLVGERLTIADQTAIRTCIHDFVVRALLPFNERRMKALNESLNVRRGLRGTLFSATKKFFNTGPKPGTPGGKPTSNPGYLTDSPEILLRRLGDIAFLLQHYTMAYNSYHAVKRDFQNDQAYYHYAAALEMTSLSLFMGTAGRRDPHSYYDECINVYMNLCKAPQYAMRAALVHCECLISRGHFNAAASWFIKMTNEEADLHSGLLMEQGAHCYVRMDPPSLRKYAFHLVLAGHKYSKAGQRKHALRCYDNAGIILKGKGWSLAENHIGFTIGRHSYNTRDIEGAYEAYKDLLSPTTDVAEVQRSQALFQKGIQDFVSVVQLYLQQQPNGTVLELPIPVVDHNKIFVSLFGEEQANVTNKLPAYNKEKAAKVVSLESQANGMMNTGSFNMFYPHQTVFNDSTNNTHRPLCAINEVITLHIPVRNPLQIPVTLSNLSLHCLHSVREPNDPIRTIKASSRGSSPNLVVKNKQKTATRDQVSVSTLEQLVLGPEENVVVALTVTPLVEGNITIAGLNYHLVSTKSVETKQQDGTVAKENPMENMIPGRIVLNPRGPRLNNTKEQRCSEVYAADNRLNVIVTPPQPLIKLSTSTLPTHLYCGEVKSGVVEVTNIGITSLSRLCLVTSNFKQVVFGEVQLEPFTPAVHPVTETHGSVVEVGYKSDKGTVIKLPNGNLKPGETAYIATWVYGGDEETTFDLLIVAYYQNEAHNSNISHRIGSCETRVSINMSVTVEARVELMTPSPDNALELLGSVVVSNVGVFSLSLQDLIVTQLSLLSDTWELQGLGKTIPLVIYPGGRISIPFKANLTGPHSHHLSSIGLGTGTQLIDSSQEHIVELYRKSNACKECEPLNENVEGDPAYKLGMIVFWEGSVNEGPSTRTLHAQQHTYLHADIAQYSPSQVLAMSMTYKNDWKTDFKLTPLLSVDVRLHITNCHPKTVTVLVTANNNTVKPDNEKQRMSLPFMWTGLCKYKLKIANNATETVDLRALFSNPGVYNLNQVSVAATLDEQTTEPPIPQNLSGVMLLKIDAV